MKIELKQINKAFGKQTVLKDFFLVIRPAAVTCVMGPSGVGKTTLLNLVLGLEKPDSGSVEITPQDEKLRPSAVFQEDRLIEEADAFTNVSLVCKDKMSKDSLKAMFSAIGLEDYENKPVRQLSGGMKRRVAILRALVADYNLLVLDEPFKGLDKELKIKVMEYVKANTEGKTVLLVTHDRSEAEFFRADIVSLQQDNILQ